MSNPKIIIGLCGDSNASHGKFRDTGGADNAGPRIFQLKRDLVTVAVADECLDVAGTDGSNTTCGSTVALCRLLRDRGWLPDGYDFLICPGAWEGTDFPNFWATTSPRTALDPFKTMLNTALALDPRNRLGFFDWNGGCNDSTDEAGYTAYMVALFGELRGTISTALNAPILVPGLPPNRMDSLLGGQGAQLAGIQAAHVNIAQHIANSVYVDSTGLTAIDSSNGYVHFCAANHRGGTNNAPGNLGEVVTNPLSERKYSALRTTPFPLQLNWNT